MSDEDREEPLRSPEPPFIWPTGAAQAAGYSWLVDRHGLDVVGHWRWTFIADRHIRRELQLGGVQYVILPPPRAPEEGDVAQLLFALRYDGVSLPVCRALFTAIDGPEFRAQLAAAVRRTPTGSYVRRAWYLFETLTGARLDLPDVAMGNYVPLLNERVHVTGPVQKHRRQRIDVNLLGDVELAPVVRRAAVADVDAAALGRRVEALVASYDDETLRRAVSYLYTRETMASFEIERERPARGRADRFIATLRDAPGISRLTAAWLVELQRVLVDPRFADDNWRDGTVYVGEAIDLARQRIHYAAPRPKDVPELMRALLALSDRLFCDRIDPVVSVAIVSFLFVLIHPFSDGNGRIHRWLVHWGLVRAGITPPNLVLPVSAVMLARRREYDEALESFSRPLMRHIDYALDDAGHMTIHGETADHYRHADLSEMVAALWRWLNLTIDEELSRELEFLVGFGRARRRLDNIVELPDQLATLFIKLCRDNGGTLSKRKRARYFDKLTDDEIADLEVAVAQAFGDAEPRRR